MEIKKEMIHREIAGDHILVPVGKTVGEFSGLFPMTESSAIIWDMLPDIESEGEAVDKLLEIYDAPREVVEKDVREFFDKLRGYGII